jgi:hypothetical protein
MTTVEFLPADSYDQKTLRQGHQPGWTNRKGGEYDFVVLGGAPTGLTAAITAAAGGRRVAVTEGRLTGGTCVNFGCTPSKALIRCARAVHDARRGAEFGFRLDSPPRTDFAAVMERVRRMRSMSSAFDAVGRPTDLHLYPRLLTSNASVAMGSPPCQSRECGLLW